jgi:hypothetical protein
MDPDPEGKLITDPPVPNLQEHLHLNSFKDKSISQAEYFLQIQYFSNCQQYYGHY